MSLVGSLQGRGIVVSPFWSPRLLFQVAEQWLAIHTQVDKDNLQKKYYM